MAGETSILLVEGQKAVIYSWPAWQKRPGQTLDITVNGDLIDFNSKEMQGLIQWLHKVFKIE